MIIKLEKVLNAQGIIYISLLSKMQVTCSEIGRCRKLSYFDSSNQPKFSNILLALVVKWTSWMEEMVIKLEKALKAQGGTYISLLSEMQVPDHSFEEYQNNTLRSIWNVFRFHIMSYSERSADSTRYFYKS